MNKPKLHAVEDSEIIGAVDSWIMPTNLPPDTAILPRRFLGQRLWKFEPEKICLLPMPAQKVENTLKDYVGFAVLTHNHRQWLLENPADIPAEYQPHHIYFPSDSYIHHNPEKPTETSRFIYKMVYKANTWIEEQVCFGLIPSMGSGRIIMMR